MTRLQRLMIACSGLAFVPPALAEEPSGEGADRRAVLSHVKANHSYYWREMYLPQVTNGADAPAWTPDGQALIVSFRGGLWRHDLNSGVTQELTRGPGYDFQPDVAADGRIVFARQQNDSIALFVLDPETAIASPIVENGAVNVDPRWSPDGAKIAYVTTAETGQFHVAIAERSNEGWTSRRWRPETVSERARYYYVATDHELSPAWAPDGRELLFIANPDVGHGTGYLYRQPLDLSESAKLVRREETSWGPQPDWSPDGRRIVYASYLGRQRRQLWLITPAGWAEPFALTFGADEDVASPRWSPDGRRIAYTSNETGAPSVRIIEVPGGRITTIDLSTLQPLTPLGAATIKFAEPDGSPVAARLSVEGGDGRAYLPTDSFAHVDDAIDPSVGRERRYGHVDGPARIALPEGAARLRAWRGLERQPIDATLDVTAGQPSDAAFTFEPAPGGLDLSQWRSGDVHVHMNYGGAYRMTPDRLVAQAQAEDLDVVFNLVVNKEQRIPDIAYVTGDFDGAPDEASTAEVVIAHGQEFHTSVWGHLGFLGLRDHFVSPDYAGYPDTAAHSLFPHNSFAADQARAQGALVGYVHPFDPPAPDPFDSERALTHALPVDAALGKIDYFEVVGFSDHKTTFDVWARLLNCGLRLPAAGGTDAMTNYASLRGPLGVDRTYVRPDAWPKDAQGRLDAWLAALKAGRSFATNAPLLELSVNGEGPGARIALPEGGGRVRVRAAMGSIAKVDRLEVMMNGAVVSALTPGSDGRAGRLDAEIEVRESGWIVVRAVADRPDPDVFDLYPFATTSPVYLEVEGAPNRCPAVDADYFDAWIDRLIAFAEASEAWNTSAEKAAVLADFKAAKAAFQARR